MDVFDLRLCLVEHHDQYVESFVRIRNERIQGAVDEAIEARLLWPPPFAQLNPTFEPTETVEGLVAEGTLHPGRARISHTGNGGGSSGFWQTNVVRWPAEFSS